MLKAVNDLIRKAREIEGIRARLIRADQGGCSDLAREANNQPGNSNPAWD
jgi:hypothetical protein